jgi:hypothetical protein
MMRNVLSPLFAPGGALAAWAAVYNAGATVLAMAAFAYICTPFQLLDARLGFEAFRALYFVGHIAAVALLVALSLVPARRGKTE